VAEFLPFSGAGLLITVWNQYPGENGTPLRWPRRRRRSRSTSGNLHSLGQSPLLRSVSACLFFRQTRGQHAMLLPPQIVNNDEDAGLQAVIIGDIFSVFMICIYYNWLWSRLVRIWRNTVGGIMTVSFEDCNWNDYTSVACALHKIWNPFKKNIHYFEDIGHTWYISLNCRLLLLQWNWDLRINTIQCFTEKWFFKFSSLRKVPYLTHVPNHWPITLIQ
jgi:hypothetical protein